MRRPNLRLTFAIWWKLLLLINAVAFVRSFAAYVLPWGQMQFWLAYWLTRVPVVGETLLSLSGTAWWPVAAEVVNGLILFVLLYGLLRFHVGRRYGGAVLAWRAPADTARDVFA